MSLEIIRIAESTGFTAAQIKAIAKARTETEAINQIMVRTACDQPHASRHEHFSWLHHEVDRLEQVLLAEPTHGNAEALNGAIARFDQSRNSASRIHETLHAASKNVSLQLAAIVNDLLDQVQATITEAGAKRAAELATTDNALFSNSDERQSLQSKLAKLSAELEATRAEAAADPLSWLTREGLAMA